MLALPRKFQEEDKRLHFSWSFWLTLAANVLWPSHWAIPAVFMIGLSKELWDLKFGSGFCIFDLLANVLGIFAATVLAKELSGPVFEL
jgi:hypothetical protein